jgi:Spy/CpxP family protein refolding chaperone
MALMAGLLTAATPVWAAEESASNQEASKPGPNRERLAQRLKDMAEKLGLSDEQKAKAKGVLQAEFAKLREVRQDTSLDQQARRQKVMALREETRKEMKTILTAEQWEKFLKIREENRRKAAEHKPDSQ